VSNSDTATLGLAYSGSWLVGRRHTSCTKVRPYLPVGILQAPTTDPSHGSMPQNVGRVLLPVYGGLFGASAASTQDSRQPSPSGQATIRPPLIRTIVSDFLIGHTHDARIIDNLWMKGNYQMLRAPLAALAATMLVVAGCGGSSETASLSQTDLIAKADAICARVHVEYHANGYTTPQSIARLAPIVAGYEQTGVDELRELRPPASMVSDWNLIVDNAQAIAQDTAKLGQYARENNLKAATPLFTADRQVQQRALATARRDGFKDCAKAS
jgi:hypothetical protein